MKNKEFTVTDDHLTLLQHMYIGWQDCEYGAPEVDPKRPYGNSGVATDIAEILEWELDANGEITDEQAGEAWELHRGTQTALQILVANLGIQTGLYVCEPYSISWRMA